MSKILVFDIETAPAEFYGWGMYNQNFGIEQVKKPGYMLCFAAKWIGKSEVLSYSIWEHGQEAMLRAARDLIEEADAFVTKNGERFDIPTLNNELALLDIPPPPPTTHIDLEKVVRKNFRFLCNKLDFIARYFGVGAKVQHEGFILWRKCLEGNEVARRKMVRYCKGDVRITERVYKKVRAFFPNHPHMGETPGRQCGACGSKHVHVSKWRRTRTMRIQQLHCQSCGSYFDGIRQKVKVE